MMVGHLGDPKEQKKRVTQTKDDAIQMWNYVCLTFFKPLKVGNLLEDQGVHEVQGIPNEKEKHTCWMSKYFVNQGSTVYYK